MTDPPPEADVQTWTHAELAETVALMEARYRDAELEWVLHHGEDGVDWRGQQIPDRIYTTQQTIQRFFIARWPFCEACGHFVETLFWRRSPEEREVMIRLSCHGDDQILRYSTRPEALQENSDRLTSWLEEMEAHFRTSPPEPQG